MIEAIVSIIVGVVVGTAVYFITRWLKRFDTRKQQEKLAADKAREASISVSGWVSRLCRELTDLRTDGFKELGSFIGAVTDATTAYESFWPYLPPDLQDDVKQCMSDMRLINRNLERTPSEFVRRALVNCRGLEKRLKGLADKHVAKANRYWDCG